MKIAEAKSIKIGKAKGKAEGHKQGEADMLLSLLTLKFKSIPDNIREQINQANETQLTEWAKKIFAAQTIEEMFQ